MLIGLWLSRPRDQDKVAVVSLISSTITTPGGPGGPGGKRTRRQRLNYQFEPSILYTRQDAREEPKTICVAIYINSNFVHILMSSSRVVAISYSNGCIRASIKRDVQMYAYGDDINTPL